MATLTKYDLVMSIVRRTKSRPDHYLGQRLQYHWHWQTAKEYSDWEWTAVPRVPSIGSWFLLSVSTLALASDHE